jgi:hypothetical protein
MLRTWRILFYGDSELLEIVEVVRKQRPTRIAKALMCDLFTHFSIQVVM